MNVDTSKLIVLFYATVAAVVFFIAYVGYRGQFAAITGWEQPSRDTIAEREPLITSNRGSDSSDRRRVMEQLQRIEQLRQSLQEKTAILQQKNMQLEQKTVEYQELRAEADRYLTMVYDLLQDSALNVDSADVMRDTDENATETSQAEAAPEGDALATELETLQLELVESQMTVAELEIAALQEHQRATDAADALISTGAPAVPSLVVALTSDQAARRAWAAEVLGRMGLDAMDAIDALVAATQDDDDNVRRAARRALEEIENQF